MEQTIKTPENSRRILTPSDSQVQLTTLALETHLLGL
jgi:hypothetical protein